MECPDCGKDVPGVGFIVGSVRVCAFTCKCGRHWRHRKFSGVVTIHDMVSELESLRSRYPGPKSEHVLQAIGFLEYQIEVSRPDKEQVKSLRERRADVWEKRFLRATIGEDI